MVGFGANCWPLRGSCGVVGLWLARGQSFRIRSVLCWRVVVSGGGRPGRPERPLNAEAGAVERLAAQLRQLREDAGRPSYRELSRRAFYSHSALSQAAAGKELPSLPVTLAFAEACGGDRREWIARWRAAAAAVGAVTGSPDVLAADALAAGADPPAAARGGVRLRLRPGRGGPRRIRGIRRPRWHLVRTAAIIAVVVSSLFWVAGASHDWTMPHLVWGSAGPRPRTSAAGLAAPVFDGSYPSVADCDGSSGMLGSSSVRAGDGAVLGTLELRYSRRCGAVWARFDPSPLLSRDRTALITVEVTRRPDGATEVHSATPTGRPQRSDMLLLHSGCALGSVKITEPGHSAASATTPCRRPL
jgi:Helix-turn-helix domain/Protein of unknown function (DUF2690)